MADNFLERHREAYELRKQQWLKKKRRLTIKKPIPPKHDDEAL